LNAFDEEFNPSKGSKLLWFSSPPRWHLVVTNLQVLHMAACCGLQIVQNFANMFPKLLPTNIFELENMHFFFITKSKSL
jgi:hypothetical protein